MRSVHTCALVLLVFAAAPAEEAPPRETIHVVGMAGGSPAFTVYPGYPNGVRGAWDEAENLPFVSLSFRSPVGIQHDISIFGGSFEGTGVSLNGVEIGDPQTAHHDLDIALIPGEIAWFELGYPGGGYGGAALTGLLDVRLKVPMGHRFTLWGGDYGLTRAYGCHGGQPHGAAGSFHIGGGYDYARSDGWRPGTDFETFSAALSAENKSSAGTTF
ncbi:MAG TPA: hypothetical protein ENN09_04595, partial [Planctomycetes bacterium]|nr:hypothetical protein [Planctomycetota bacterium]